MPRGRRSFRPATPTVESSYPTSCYTKHRTAAIRRNTPSRPKIESPKAKYVYLKTRAPAIYTRYEIEHVNANKEFFRLTGKSVTNPYGDRNLEQATALPYEVTKQLADEAKTAFRQNKRPTKPDLPKLVKEAKEKAEKDKPRQ